MQTNNLQLAYNFNSKLDCDSFTVICPLDEKLFQKGQLLELYLRSEPLGQVRVLEHRRLPEERFNDWITYIDCGYNAAKTKQILRRVYRAGEEERVYSWALLTYVRRYQAEEWLKQDHPPRKNKQLELQLLLG